MSGYYRFPTITEDSIVFVSEDDLWSVPASGGVARRLTSGLGTCSHPFFSPDGSLIAFTGREEGSNEVYCMPSLGGPVKRLTFLGVSTTVMGWTPDGASIVFTSDHEQPIDRIGVAYSISPEGGMPVRMPIGPAMSISITDGNRTVIGRNNNDPARWKRYKGGTAGDIWVDAAGNGEFSRLITLKGNVGRPMWVGDRIYFLSDHEGIANIFSCTASGEDISQHTFHSDFFARFPSTNGKKIVYHAGGDLYVLDLSTNTTACVDVTYPSSFTHRQRKFVDASRYIQSYSLSPKGDQLAITARGKGFVLGNWEGAVSQLSGEFEGPQRLRLSTWLNDSSRVVSISDRTGEEVLEIHSAGNAAANRRFEDLDIGKPINLKVSPVADKVAISNHRNELLVVDLTDGSLTQVDRSQFGGIGGFDWSPDGNWLAYGFAATHYTAEIRVADHTNGEKHAVTVPTLIDSDPAFDPEGKYLYFIGTRELNPVYDNLQFDLGFPKGARPYLITLQSELTNPFQPSPHPLGDEKKAAASAGAAESPDKTPPKSDAPTPCTVIDFDGIAERVVAFPVAEGRYGQVAGIKGKALFTNYPVEGALKQTVGEEHPRGVLESFDFAEQKHEALLHRISEFDLSRDSKTLIYRSNRRLRVITAGSKSDEKAGQDSGRKSGWIDLSRIKILIDPAVEWMQMAREAWRLQREHFWTENMSGIDWTAVWNRYSPLVSRVASRGEFSDLMWEMQGELGTSHAYESGGDYRTEPNYPQGYLGANLTFDSDANVYRIAEILHGDAGDARRSSPLLGPGINVNVGDAILEINGRRLTAALSPYQALTNMAGQEVTLSVKRGDEPSRSVTVVTMRSEVQLRYRQWVEANRKLVHDATDGKVGYVHVPDMGAHGYAEFHRLFLTEVDRDALIVDVRYNRGGHVSQLLIEKLNRRRVGYNIPRWAQPEPYPGSSVAGPIVALTNQFAGSDGDIFSHVFKLMNLGTLIGKRTWGGVVGIWPRHPLADGSITTQPEFSFWFQDVGWGVENYGTDPHIDIDIAPQDYASNRDPQMERAIQVVLEQLEANPVVRPAFDQRPVLALPWQE